MFRRRFLQSLAALCPAPLAAQPRERRPNLVFILADDMGYADIEPYGARDIRTPHLSRLAGEGVKFSHCYSNGPVCTPTRCAFMTGRWQQRCGLEWALTPADRGKGLSPSEVTLPRLLKNSGYRTAIFGKWHLGMEREFNPLRHGFDEFFGITSGNVDMYSHQYRTGFDDLWEGEELVRRDGYLTDLLGDRAVSFIRKNAKDPFFLYLPFNAVHWPFQAPGRPGDQRTEATWYDGTRERHYKPMLESMDANIGKVLAALDAYGLAENTLVVFTNDNGGERLSDNRPLFHKKGTLWEGGIRVPAIARWPGGGVLKGATISQPAITMDFTATLLSAAGVRPTPGQPPLDGIDLLPAMRDPQWRRERTFFWRIDRADRKQQAVRHGKWKWMRDGSIELLLDVQSETVDYASLLPAYQAEAARLRALYQEWERELERNPPPFVVK